MAYIGRDLEYGVLDKQSLTGADGSKTVWNDLTYGVATATNLLVSVGGVIQEPDVAYTASGTVLTFTEAPEASDTIYVIYLGKELAIPTAQSDLAYQTGTGDGSDTTPITTLSRTVTNATDIMVMLNGVTQVPGTDFTVSGTTLTFITAPADGMNVLVYFLGIAMNIGTPADNTVSTSKLMDDSVTQAKIHSGVILGGTSIGNNNVIRTNTTTITANATFLGNTNGMSAGPVSIAAGITVSMTSGSVWTIV